MMTRVLLAITLLSCVFAANTYAEDQRELQVTKAVTVVKSDRGFKAKVTGTVKYTGEGEAYRGGVSFKCRPEHLKCPMCENQEQWKDLHGGKVFPNLRKGETRTFDIVYAELEANPPDGKTPPAPQCELCYSLIKSEKVPVTRWLEIEE